jgi:hypothetical protein
MIRPTAPPASDSTMLSVSNWRTMRLRLAPMAARTANSLRRVVERASSRLATFAQAISSTNPTAPNSTSRVEPTSPTITLVSGFTLMPCFALDLGYASASRAAMALISDCAREGSTFGLSLATTYRPGCMSRERTKLLSHCPNRV